MFTIHVNAQVTVNVVDDATKQIIRDTATKVDQILTTLGSEAALQQRIDDAAAKLKTQQDALADVVSATERT